MNTLSRVLCVHWLNDGCAYKENLWDIYYAVGNRPNDFDWQKRLGVIMDKKRKVNVLGNQMAEKYLNLNHTDIPVEAANFKVPAWG